MCGHMSPVLQKVEEGQIQLEFKSTNMQGQLSNMSDIKLPFFTQRSWCRNRNLLGYSGLFSDYPEYRVYLNSNRVMFFFANKDLVAGG